MVSSEVEDRIKEVTKNSVDSWFSGDDVHWEETRKTS